MKSQIIEKINDKLSKFSESKLAKIDGYFENMTTDTSSNEHSPKARKLPIINKEALVADKYGNTPLSLAIEEGNIEQVRELYKIQKEELGDTELLKKIAIDMMNSSIQEHYNLTQDIFSRVYSEAKYQLDLLGEDTTEVIDAYNLD